MMLQRGPRVPCQRAEPLPEPVRGSHGHGWPPGRACAPLGNSPSPSSCPLGSHCLTVRHRAAFRALPIMSSRDKIAASSSLSERGTGVVAFSGPMPRHNTWMFVLSLVSSALAAQPAARATTDGAREDGRRNRPQLHGVCVRGCLCLAGVSRPPTSPTWGQKLTANAGGQSSALADTSALPPRRRRSPNPAGQALTPRASIG